MGADRQALVDMLADEVDTPVQPWVSAAAEAVRLESVITVTGSLVGRSADTVNEQLPTGHVEVAIEAFELQAAAGSLNYVGAVLQDKRPGHQWHRITNRVIQDLQHRCMLRTAPEEFNLSVNRHDHDVLNAEFIRTYMAKKSPGGALLRRLELEKSAQGAAGNKQ